MVKLTDNKKYTEYIEEQICLKFNNVQIIDLQYEKLPNSSFYVKFRLYNTYVLIFKDRFYVCLEIEENGDYVNLNELDSNINNLKLCTENIDYYVNFLKQYFEKKQNRQV